ncbi:Uncharacterized protein dnm_096350 [Desulfonema magnum]|uniref:Uncharacterized protein n=1 Tax=Desulfonema magnum TaxID=45655 RepID=A0A975BXH8_9BACT|nr:Uncharacterized protein dnm_096350 [Desulfonema magnum]
MITNYVERINKRFGTGISTEHTFRGDLQSFLESLGRDVLVTNEPSRIACGAPDYIITKKNIPRWNNLSPPIRRTATILLLARL